jgi:aspartate/methionine/tyrosine aminotransferase
VREALATGCTHYTPALGLPPLREAIADFYGQSYGVHIAPERVIVTPGASGALLAVTGVLIDPGDEVLMADPGYPCNRHFVRLAEGEAVAIPVTAATAYQLTPELVESHWTARTRAVLVASPSNPTGTLISREHLQGIWGLVQRKGASLIVDEIYHGLVYDERPDTALSLSDQVFVVNSFSKFFGMTGWRVGWLVTPSGHLSAIDRLVQNVFLAPSTPGQHAALAAFLPETLAILECRRDEFRERRDFLLGALRSLGFDIPVTPQGALYLYADCSRFSGDSYALATALLEQAGVAVTPGRDFGVNAAHRHLRFAYTTGLEQLQRGVDRIQAFLGRSC